MQSLIEQLTEILEDDSIPRNIKGKIENAVNALNEKDKEDGFKANKALQELDEISDDPNIPSYLRPQIWNIVSKLETL